MPTTTSMQAFPVPVAADDPDVPSDMLALAQAIEKRVVGVYVSAADRDAKITSPQNGQVALTTDTYKIYAYQAGAWVQVLPPVIPAFTNGTTVPSNATGANGDIFFKV